MRGRVIWFNDFKGYGEIQGTDGKRYFAHYHSIRSSDERKTLKEGQTVTFQPEKLPENLYCPDFFAAASRILAKP